MERTDVLILGGGPAGCAAAMSVRAKTPELDVLVAEAKPAGEPEPRPLRSGEVLFAKHRRELERIGVEVEGSPWALHDVTRFRVVSPDGREHRAEVPWPSRLVEIDRAAYDGALRAAAVSAGARVRQGARATDLTVRDRRVAWVTLGSGDHATEVAARWVVDAGGRFALVPRKLGLKETPLQRNHAVLTAFYRDFPQDRDVWEILIEPEADTVEISTPVPGLTRLGLGTPMNVLRGSRMPADELFEQRARLSPELADRLDRSGPLEYTWTSAPVAYRVRPPDLANVLLAGDARGYLTPFYGDGNLIALATGRRAGERIARESRGGPGAAAAQRREHRSLSRRDWWRAQALRVFEYPTAVNALFASGIWKTALKAQAG